jgi:ABC-2 type transport system ATP-binding protein
MPLGTTPCSRSVAETATSAAQKARISPAALEVRVREPLDDPAAVLGAVEGVSGWQNGNGAGVYVVDAADPEAVAPVVAKAVVDSGAALVRLSPVERSLEDAYLELVERER